MLRKGCANGNAFIRKEKFWAEILRKVKTLKALKETVRCVYWPSFEYGNEQFFSFTDDTWTKQSKTVKPFPFSSPEAGLLLVTAPRIATTGKVQHSKSAIQGLLITLRMLRFKFSKYDWLTIRNDYAAYGQTIGPSQWSQFLVLTKKRAASGNVNDRLQKETLPSFVLTYLLPIESFCDLLCDIYF